MIPPSKACLFGHINWSLVQAQQQSSTGLSQSYPFKRGGKARPWTGFHFTVQKRPVPGSVPGSSGASLAKRPHLESGNEAFPSGKKSPGGSVSTSSADTRRKEAMGVSTHDVSQSSASSSSSAVFQVGMLFNFLITGEALLLTGMCLIWYRLTIFSLERSCPPLFCNFWQFNVKVAAAHHPIIQKEVDELLSKEVIESSSGGAGFYSNMFVVPKHTGGLWPILYLKWFSFYLHIPSFKVPTIRHVWQLIQHGNYAFSIDLQDAYLHIPSVKHYCHFLQSVWHNMPYQWKVLLLGWPQPLRFSQSSLNIFCSFVIASISVLLSIWMTSWSWVAIAGR